MMPQRRRLRAPDLVLVAVLVLATSLGGLAVTTLTERSYVRPSVTAALTAGGSSLSVHLTAGAQPVPFHLVVGQLAPARTVYVLVDSNYPQLVTGFRNVKGLYDHLAIALPTGGYGGAIRRVDARELADAMQKDPHGILVVGSGAMPDTVVGPNHDFAPVKTFLTGGGELVFAGDGLFYWAARRGQQSFDLTDKQARIDWAGSLGVLGYDLVHDPSGDPRGQVSGNSPSATAQALGINHTLAQRGARLGQLTANHGWDVGSDTTRAPGSQRTSLAVVPVGSGHIILFGSGLYGFESAAANDISRLILSGSDIAPPLGSASSVLDEHGDRTLLIPLPAPGATGGVRLLAYDSGGYDYYHATIVIPGGPEASPVPGASVSPSASASPSPAESPSPASSESPSPSPSPSP